MWEWVKTPRTSPCTSTHVPVPQQDLSQSSPPKAPVAETRHPSLNIEEQSSLEKVMKIKSVAVSCSPIHITVSFSTVAIASFSALQAGGDIGLALADQEEEEGEDGSEGGHAGGHAGEDWEKGGQQSLSTQKIRECS